MADTKQQQQQQPTVTDPGLKFAMGFPQFGQEAQNYGLTPQQYAAVLQQTQQGPNYGNPTAYGAQGQQQMPNVPQQQNIQMLRALTNMGINPQQQQQSLQQALQQQQSQQTSSLQDMWNAYMKQGAQQTPTQQPAQAATITPTTPYQGQQLGTATPYATIPQAQTPSVFAPPPPPAPGQGQQWQPPQQQQWPQVQRFQQGGLVQNQDPQQQGYLIGDYNQGITNPRYYQSALGSLGGSMIINPWPNQGGQGGQGQDGMGQGGMSKGGVYTGPQQPTVYGADRGMPTPSIVPGSLGQYTFPNGGQLTQDQMARFMNGTPDEQALVASALGTTPQAITQAAQTYQGTYQGGGGTTGGGGATGSWSVPNAPVQRVFSGATGSPAVTPGLYNAATMPTPSGGGQSNITPTPVANAAAARPLGAPGVPWALPPPSGTTPIPPSSVMPPPMMMPGGGMFGGMGGQPPAAPAGVANYTAGGVGAPPQFMAAHNDALTKAGGAFYTHMTGEDPSTATPEQVQNVYNQLMTHATAMINAAAPGGSAAGGAATALGTGASAAPAKKMSTGGPVTGTGNGDTVPALLTPGEYVLNRQQTAQLFGGRNPIKMATGGPVPDDNEPPEVRRQPLTVPTAGNQQATPQAQPGPSQTTSTSTSPDDQSHPGYPSAAAARAALNSGGASGGGYNIPANLGGGYIGASPGTGQSGYAYPSQAAATAAGDVGTGVTGGGGANIGGAVSTLASGLASAAKTYADSFKEYKILPNAIPQPAGTQAAPVQLAQQQAQRPRYDPATLASYGNYFLNT